MPLIPAKKQKTPAYIREIQVHKLWTKVYSQQGLTAMLLCILVEVLTRANVKRGKRLNDLKFGTFISCFLSNGAASMAVKGLNTVACTGICACTNAC